MNIKKDAANAIAKKLEKEQADIRYKISRNKYLIKQLVEEQSKLKRELGLIQPLINTMKGY